MDISEVDNYENVDPQILNQFYGTYGHARRRAGQTGAGHSDSEEDQSSDDEHASDDSSQPDSSDSDESPADNLRDELNSKLKHEAVEVPPSVSPFTSDDQLDTFLSMLNDMFNNKVIPSGYGVQEEEMGIDGYKEEEHIKVGFRAIKVLTMSLPKAIWYH